jgi:hypothetical protein
MKVTDEGVCLFTVEEFKEACDQGCFTDDDGSGYYSSGYFSSKMYKSDVIAKPSDFMKNKIDTTWSHVIWYPA